MIRLGVLGSTKGSDLQAVLDAIHNDALDAAVVVVVSNRENSYILERARNHNIPDVFVPHTGKTRDEFDREITTALLQHNADLVLLVGFMRILSPEFCRKWQDRILNVHPSLLPKYAGGMDTNVHEEVLRNGDMETGCTIHFVTEEVDAGPILIQRKCAVTGEDTVESLKTKVQQLEGMAFIEAIEMIANKY
jgi:phosphoribosylglycinamide formyltransferase-1